MTTRRGDALQLVVDRLAAVEPFASGGGARGVNSSDQASQAPNAFPRCLVWVLGATKGGAGSHHHPYRETIELQVQVEVQLEHNETRADYQVCLEAMAPAEVALLALRDEMSDQGISDVVIREWELLEPLSGGIAAVAYDVRLEIDHTHLSPEVSPDA